MVELHYCSGGRWTTFNVKLLKVLVILSVQVDLDEDEK